MIRAVIHTPQQFNIAATNLSWQDTSASYRREKTLTPEEFEEAKKQSAEIAKLLRDGSLAPEDRQKLEMLQTQLAGTLLSPWLPFNWERRAIMIVLFLVGAIGLVEGNSYFLFSWLFLLLFSPRLMGEFAFALGRLMAGFNGRV